MGWPRRRAKRTADLKVWPPLPMPTAEEEERQERAAELEAEGSRRQEHLTVPDTRIRDGAARAAAVVPGPHGFSPNLWGFCDCGRPAADPLHHGQPSGEPVADRPRRTESVTEFLARTPHQFLPSRAFSGPLAGRCECKLAEAEPVHDQGQDRAMLNTGAYLAGLAAEMEAARRPERPWNPDGPHELTEDDEQAGMCECGRPEGDWRHREVPQQAGPVTSEGGWLAESVARSTEDAVTAAREAARAALQRHEEPEEPEPDTTPLHKPEPLPDGVLGYVVVLRGDYRTGLADSDLRPTLREARADAKAHGRRPGWAGRAVACEVRVAPR